MCALGWCAPTDTRHTTTWTARGVCWKHRTFDIAWPSPPAVIGDRDLAWPDFVA
jgi:dTDP-4-dehydrorhamnose 3,5-epimerase-like enzyme